MFYLAATKLVCRYFSHQVHRAIKIFSTARTALQKENLIFKVSPCRDRLQIIYKQRVIRKRKGSHNISHVNFTEKNHTELQNIHSCKGPTRIEYLPLTAWPQIEPMTLVVLAPNPLYSFCCQ